MVTSAGRGGRGSREHPPAHICMAACSAHHQRPSVSTGSLEITVHLRLNMHSFLYTCAMHATILGPSLSMPFSSRHSDWHCKSSITTHCLPARDEQHTPAVHSRSAPSAALPRLSTPFLSARPCAGMPVPIHSHSILPTCTYAHDGQHQTSFNFSIGVDNSPCLLPTHALINVHRSV